MINFLKTHKVIFWTLIVVLFGVVIWGISLSYKKKIERAPQQTATTTAQPLTGTSIWPVYRNEELGFEIRIPDTWNKKYKIEEIKTIGPGFGAVSFSKKVEWVNKVGDTSFSEHMILGITVATPEQWGIMNSAPTARPIVLKITDKKVYVYGTTQDGDKKERDEISAVLSTFKLIQ